MTSVSVRGERCPVAMDAIGVRDSSPSMDSVNDTWYGNILGVVIVADVEVVESSDAASRLAVWP